MLNILITGGSGFLGRHVQDVFRPYVKAQTITLYAPSSSDLNLLLATPRDIAKYLSEKEIDVVIHLAASCGGIGANRNWPGTFAYDNVVMSANLIKACASYGYLHNFVGIGSVCMYPNITLAPFREDDIYNGYPEETNASYGIAKRMQLELLRGYAKETGLCFSFLVPTNMAGPYDNFSLSSSHVIPALIQKFHEAKKFKQRSVTLWGDGTATRDFIDARDVAEVIARVALRGNNTPDPINLGSGQEVSIDALAKMIAEIIEYDGTVTWDTNMPNGQPRRVLNIQRAQALLGFKPHIKLEQTIHDAYSWARNEGIIK